MNVRIGDAQRERDASKILFHIFKYAQIAAKIYPRGFSADP